MVAKLRLCISKAFSKVETLNFQKYPGSDDPESETQYLQRYPESDDAVFLVKLRSGIFRDILDLMMQCLMLNHHLLSAEQSAYRQHYSTEIVTLKIASDIFDAADAEKVTVLSLLDLSAVFDTVDHSILLQRLTYTRTVSLALLYSG